MACSKTAEQGFHLDDKNIFGNAAMLRVLKHFFARRPDKSQIFSDPNRHAPRAHVELLDGEAHVFGYQQYTLTTTGVVAAKQSYDLDKKIHMLDTLLYRDALTGKSFLDLGAAGGFFTFHAAIMGADAIAVDIDEKHLNIIRQVAQHLHFDNVRVARKNIDEWTEPADYVNALAIIHWIYSCTSIMGSMEKMIAFLRGLTREVLIVEWIDPEDVAIQTFGHLDFNRQDSDGSYRRDHFIDALNHQFGCVKSLGESRAGTREIFLCEV